VAPGLSVDTADFVQHALDFHVLIRVVGAEGQIEPYQMNTQVVWLECGYTIPQPGAERASRHGGREFGQPAEQNPLLCGGELVGIGSERFEFPVEVCLLRFHPQTCPRQPDHRRVTCFLFGRRERGERLFRVPVTLILGREGDPYHHIFGLLDLQIFKTFPRLRRLALKGEKAGPQHADFGILRKHLLGHPDCFLGLRPVRLLVGGRQESLDHSEARDRHPRPAARSLSLTYTCSDASAFPSAASASATPKHRGHPQRVDRVHGHGPPERLPPSVENAQLLVTPAKE